MLSIRRGYFAILGTALITSVSSAQFTQVTGTASDFVPQDQVRIDAQLEKEGRLILTKALGHVPLSPDQKTEVKEILDGRTATEKTFREVHKVPNATVRAFNLEQTRLAIAAIHQILTTDQWDQFCAAQTASLEKSELPPVAEAVVVDTGGTVLTGTAAPVIVLVPKIKHVHKHVHEHVKVVKVVKLVKIHKPPNPRHVKAVPHIRATHPRPPVHRVPAPVHRAH